MPPLDPVMMAEHRAHTIRRLCLLADAPPGLSEDYIRRDISIADIGDRIRFTRSGIMGRGETWLPRPGDVVIFSRAWDRWGLEAYRVRPIGTTWPGPQQEAA